MANPKTCNDPAAIPKGGNKRTVAHGKDLGERPTELDDFMKAFGDHVISAAWIGRKPVDGNTVEAMNAMTNRAINKVIKENNLEGIFHYFLVLQMDVGVRKDLFLIEKNEQVVISGVDLADKSNVFGNEKIKLVPITFLQTDLDPAHRPTFNQVIKRGETDSCFYYYEAWDYNCQKFVSQFIHNLVPDALKKKYKLNSKIEKLDQYVIQKEFLPIFQEHPKFKKLAKVLTDAAAAMSKKGGCVIATFGEKNKKAPKSKCINLSHMNENDQYLDYEPYKPIKALKARSEYYNQFDVDFTEHGGTILDSYHRGNADEFRPDRSYHDTLSDAYYHGYGAYDHANNSSEYLLLFAIGSVIFIGICCVIIIMSIIGGFISGRFYEMKGNQQSQRNRHKYESVNENEDQI